MGLDAWGDLFWETRNSDEIIGEKIKIVNEGTRQFSRRTDPVGKAEGGCVLFPWWTVPVPIMLLIAKRLFFGQLAELFLWFPFLPARLGLADDKEVGRMKVRRSAPRGC